MAKPIISVRGISKQYRLGAAKSQDTLRDQLTHWAKNLGKEQADASESFWALRDVCFDVKPGEVFGFLGANGEHEAFVQVLNGSTGEATYVKFDVNAFNASAETFSATTGNNTVQ